jgi:uncharacterized protein with HEPN domain
MAHDPIIAIRDVLAEIELLHGIAGRLTLQSFKADPIARHAAAYAIQIISEAVRQIPDDWLADYPAEPWAHEIRLRCFDLGHRLGAPLVGAAFLQEL